ncbi:hypothetical protein AVEN_1274-1 [Araneus ventricosus]|uniref:Uncharacterized protein n=1 Tax=Araneus ventricosus TaxID=182803 RepID=A0A4Y2NI95_ARAVE|nr:hypothetical protein AVEN_1274-1 [Araneus ventricosus]
MTVATTAFGTKVGVLVAITGHSPSPPKGGTSFDRSGGTAGKLSPQSNILLFLEEFSKEKPAEDKYDASHLDGKVAEYSDHEADSEIGVDDNPVRDSN